MIRSMTGYAREEMQVAWGRLSWEMRSVNHRYLDLHLRMPDELRPLEPDIRARINDAVRRGKLDCGLRFEREAASTAALELDINRVRQIQDACRTVETICNPIAPMDPLAVLAWPGVVRESSVDMDSLRSDVLALLDRTLDSLDSARAREGGRLAQLISERGSEVLDLARRVRERLPEVRDAWRSRLQARLSEASPGFEPDSGRLEQEMLMMAQRMDVDEELSRLESHIQELDQALTRPEPVGRRLDFLMQEFNREANTLSSKSQDAEITRMALEMKVMIEQMREQVQNVE